MLKLFSLVAISCLFLACDGGDPSLLGLQLRLIPLQGRSPLYSTAGSSLPKPWDEQRKTLESYGFLAFARLVYSYGASDTVAVTILEFHDDMSALGFQLNGGYTREGLPVVKGELQESSIRAGRRVFLFASPVMRPLSADAAEQFVKVFPGFRAGLPQEFLALPIKNREPGGTSMQLHSFLGVMVDFPMLVQRYGDASGRWQCARSWTTVSNREWNHFLAKISQLRTTRTTSVGTVACDGQSCAWMDRLSDGRVVATYGETDFTRLSHYFLMARQTLEDSEK